MRQKEGRTSDEDEEEGKCKQSLREEEGHRRSCEDAMACRVTAECLGLGECDLVFARNLPLVLPPRFPRC